MKVFGKSGIHPGGMNTDAPKDSSPNHSGRPTEGSAPSPLEGPGKKAAPAGGRSPVPFAGRIVGPPRNGTPPAERKRRSQARKGGPIGSPKPPAVRVSLRSPTQRSTFLQVAHRITERDVDILFDLHEHRVLTTHQLTELHFNSPRVATRRLTTLWELGFIDRFQPHRPTGSNPYHYVLAEAGAFVISARIGVDFKEFDWSRTNPDKAPFNPFLNHLVESNSFFTRLAHAYRRSGAGQLVTWQNGYDASFQWSVIPDGLGTIREGKRSLQFAYEHDRGTESSEQIKDKIEGYFRIALVRSDKKRLKDPLVILFTFPSERRENIRPFLGGSGFPLATAVFSRVMEDPLGRVWLPLDEKVPMRLIDLGYLEPLWNATVIR